MFRVTVVKDSARTCALNHWHKGEDRMAQAFTPTAISGTIAPALTRAQEERMDAGVHCMGNGRLAVYARGTEILQVFGPPYSSTSSLEATIVFPEPVDVGSAREQGTAIWRHELRRGGASIGRITDFVDARAPAFVRSLELEQPLVIEVHVGESAEAIENSERFEAHGARAALLVTAPRGSFVFMKYPSPLPFSHQLVAKGRVSLQRVPGRVAWRLAFEPGPSTLLLAGGPAWPTCVEVAEEALAAPVADLLDRTRAWWRGFSERRRDLASVLPADTPLREQLLQAADDVAVLIKTQQGVEGGILAGLSYHWAAFRDQFGAMRCLLALGHRAEAKAILRYYGDIFRARGALHNGQDIGLDGFFHVHENDEVEITGSLLTQAFDYLGHTGDDPFLRELFPMLEWAFDAQRRNLLRHMLPFNGDETYIAGGMMPRRVINDGSAESTMLFVTGGERFLGWTERQGLWPSDRIAEARRAVDETRAHYKESFWRDGFILTNNPARMTTEEMPRFRHGVCESGAYLPEHDGLRCQGGAIGWVEKSADGHYLCPSCLSRGIVLPPGRPIYRLASVSLVPLYLGSDLFSREEIGTVAADIIERYQRTGRLTTTPDSPGTVGFDFGLLLYTLAELYHPLASRVYRHMMDVRDSAGAWVEYYRDDRPMGCPCRPYESGINLEAGLHFALRGRPS